MAYATTKGAVMSFTRAIAREFGPKWNALQLCRARPDLHARHGLAFEGQAERLVGKIPLGRSGQPSEVGDVMAHLAVDAPGFVSGAFVTSTAERHARE